MFPIPSSLTNCSISFRLLPKYPYEDILHHLETMGEVDNAWESIQAPSFVDELRKMFGDNINVLLYGSAAEALSSGNGDCRDYDVLVVVEPRIKPSHYNALENKKLMHNGKRVGVVLVSNDVFPSFIIRNAYSIGLVKYSKILYEGLKIPRVNLPSLEDAVMREVARAAGRIRVLNSIALNFIPNLSDKEGLFESCANKTARFVLQAALDLKSYQAGKIPNTKKAELEELLLEEGIKPKKFSKHWDKKYKALLQAVCDTAKIVRKYFPIPKELKEPVAEVLARCGDKKIVKQLSPYWSFYLDKFTETSQP